MNVACKERSICHHARLEKNGIKTKWPFSSLQISTATGVFSYLATTKSFVPFGYLYRVKEFNLILLPVLTSLRWPAAISGNGGALF